MRKVKLNWCESSVTKAPWGSRLIKVDGWCRRKSTLPAPQRRGINIEQRCFWPQRRAPSDTFGRETDSSSRNCSCSAWTHSLILLTTPVRLRVAAGINKICRPGRAKNSKMRKKKASRWFLKHFSWCIHIGYCQKWMYILYVDICTSNRDSSNWANCIFLSSSCCNNLVFSVSNSGFSCWMVKPSS